MFLKKIEGVGPVDKKFSVSLLWGSAQGRSTSPIWNTYLFLKLHAGTVHESNLKHLLVFRLHAGTINESNPEQHLVCNAPHGDNPQVQSGTPPCFYCSTRGRSMSLIRNTTLFLRHHAWTIHKPKSTNLSPGPEHLLVFKAPLMDNPRVQSGTPQRAESVKT